MTNPVTAAVRLLSGMKEPVRLASTANLALSGLLTVDSVVTVVGDRVLAKDQTAATANGIYIASVGVWKRAPDTSTERLIKAGMRVVVQAGTVNAGRVYNFDTDEPEFGTDNIVLSRVLIDGATAFGNSILAAANAAAGTALLGAATDALPGVVELATVAEAGTGTDTARAVTAAGLFPAEADIASAATTAIGAATSKNLRITGTTTVTGFGTIAAGVERNVRFAGALTLTHNATSLILPGAANIVTAAGDTLSALSLGSGNWYVKHYTRASGRTILGAAIQTKETIFRNAGTGITGPVSAASWVFPGAAATASLMTFYFSFYPARKIIFARWNAAWTPKPGGAGGANAGLRLIHCDSGPANIVAIGAAFEVNTPASPIGSPLIFTTELQALIDAGVDKFIGHQMYGDGTTGSLLYTSELEIWWTG